MFSPAPSRVSQRAPTTTTGRAAAWNSSISEASRGSSPKRPGASVTTRAPPASTRWTSNRTIDAPRRRASTMRASTWGASAASNPITHSRSAPGIASGSVRPRAPGATAPIAHRAVAAPLRSVIHVRAPAAWPSRCAAAASSEATVGPTATRGATRAAARRLATSATASCQVAATRPALPRTSGVVSRSGAQTGLVQCHPRMQRLERAGGAAEGKLAARRPFSSCRSRPHPQAQNGQVEGRQAMGAPEIASQRVRDARLAGNQGPEACDRAEAPREREAWGRRRWTGRALVPRGTSVAAAMLGCHGGQVKGLSDRCTSATRSGRTRTADGRRAGARGSTRLPCRCRRRGPRRPR